jgi:hypothetical protein
MSFRYVLLFIAAIIAAILVAFQTSALQQKHPAPAWITLASGSC